LFVFAALAAALTASTPAPAAPAFASAASGNFAGISRQRWDSTCGLAALATLMRVWGGDTRATEDELLRLWRTLPGSSEAALRDGLSRAALSELVRSWGLPFAPTEWIALRPRDLPRLAKPVVVLIRRPNAPAGHFVVLKGVRDGTALLADPLLGHVAEPLDTFVAQWADAGGARGLILPVERADGRALAESALRMPGEAGAVVRHASPREAVLRGQALTAPGQFVVTIEHSRTSVQGNPGTRAPLDSRGSISSLEVQWGARDGIALSAGVAVRSFRHLREEGRTAWQESRKADLTLGLSALLREERDDGTPSITGTVTAGLGAASIVDWVEVEVRADRNWRNFSAYAAVGAGQAFGGAGAGDVSSQSYNARGGVSFAPAGRVYILAELGVSKEAGFPPVVSATLGLNGEIGRGFVLTPTIAWTAGGYRSRTIGVSVTFVR
jgi:predicted double-glycine peptidase